MTTSQGDQMALKHKVNFFEVSSNNDTNVNETMDALAQLMYTKYESLVDGILGGRGPDGRLLIDSSRKFRDESDGGGFSLGCCAPRERKYEN